MLSSRTIAWRELACWSDLTLLPGFSPTRRLKREVNVGPADFHREFWDSYWRRTGQLLANFSLAPVAVPDQKSLQKWTRSSSLLVSKVASAELERKKP